jgi:hypothetical protein
MRGAKGAAAVVDTPPPPSGTRPPPDPAVEPPAGAAGEAGAAGSAAAREEEKLLASSASKEGGALSNAEMEAEQSWIRRNQGAVRKSPMKGYTNEIELPNGHTWRQSEGGGWCRFSETPIAVPAPKLPGLDTGTPVVQRAPKIAIGNKPLVQTLDTAIEIGGTRFIINADQHLVLKAMHDAATSALPAPLAALDKNMVAANVGAVVTEGAGQPAFLFQGAGQSKVVSRFGSPAIFESTESILTSPSSRYLSTPMGDLARFGVKDFTSLAEFQNFINQVAKKSPDFALDIWKTSFIHSEQAFYAMLRADPGMLADMLEFAGVAKGATVHAAVVDLFTTRMMCPNCIGGMETMLANPKMMTGAMAEALEAAGYKVAGGDLPAVVRASFDRPFGVKTPRPMGERPVMGTVPTDELVESEASNVGKGVKFGIEMPSICVR